MRLRSLKAKFVLLAALVIVIPLIVTTLFAQNLYRKLTDERMRTLHYNNMLHIGLTVENYVQNASELATYIIGNDSIRAFLLADTESPDYAQCTSFAASTLSSFPVSSRFINKATVFSNSGISINNNNYYPLSLTEEQKQRALGLRGHLFWETEITPADQTNRLVLCRSIRDTRNLSHQIGFLKIALNMESLRSALLPAQDLGRISYHIIDKDKMILSTDTEALESLPPEDELYQYVRRGIGTCISEDRIYLSACPIDKTDWLLFSISPADPTRPFSHAMLSNALLSSAICICVCLTIAVFFGNIVTKPLKKIGDMMHSVSSGDFSSKMELRGSDELTVLARQFNDMSEKLDFLYNEVFQSQLRLKEAEISALVSQMNPHFLYNTLDTIYWMAKGNQTQAVSEMVSNLSKLMRLSMPGSGDYVSLATELEQIRCYIAIQEIRFQDQISFSLSADSELMSCRVLKLILQPLVENAIVHGVTPVGGGDISIEIFRENEDIVYRVSNTGKLLDAEEIHRLLIQPQTEKKGFALKNIAERLRLSFGSRYTLDFGFENGHTYFKVRQPAVPFKEDTDVQTNDC